MTNSDDVRISVIIPTQGRASLRASLDSVLAQSMAHFEIIVVFNGVDVIPDWLSQRSQEDQRVHVITRQQEGVAAARNEGAQRACAPWLTFLDDDDTARPRWLETWLDHATPPVALVTSCVAFHQSGSTRTRQCRVDPQSLGISENTLLAGGFAARRDLFQTISGYDNRLDFSENTDLALRFADHLEQGETLAISEVLVDIWVGNAAARAERYGRRRAAAASLMLANHPERFTRDPKAAADYWRIVAHGRRMANDPLAAMRGSTNAVLRHPMGAANWRSLALSLATAFPVARRLQHRRARHKTSEV